MKFGHQTLVKATRPSHFCTIQAFVDPAFSEQGGFAVLRVGRVGIRCYALVSFTEAKKHVENIEKVSDTDAKRVKLWFADLTPSKCMEAVADGVKFFYLTVGMHDAVYIPAGYLCFERVMRDSDVVGFKMCVMAPQNGMANNYFQEVKKANDKANESQALVDEHIQVTDYIKQCQWP